MPTFVLNRNYTLQSTYGHIINFKKGEPTHVPPLLVKECVQIGAEQTDGVPDVLGDEKEAVQLTLSERQELLKEAFKDIVSKNDPEDFSAQGAPRVDAVEKSLNMKFTRAEILEAWQVFKASLE
jgi:hypothetical protein